jgi:hypothetical protein
MFTCSEPGFVDSHFNGSYLLVALMGGTFDIRVVLIRSLVRLVLSGAGLEEGWVGNRVVHAVGS